MAEPVADPGITISARAYRADIPRLDRIVKELLTTNPKATRSDAIRLLLDAYYEATQPQRKRAGR